MWFYEILYINKETYRVRYYIPNITTASDISGLNKYE